MSDRCFVDTNILVYAHDRGAGAKHEKAAALIEELWSTGTGVVSTQVLQELYVNVRRRAAQPISAEDAAGLIEDYLCWNLVVNDGASIRDAIQIEARYGLSFWDALIVQAANQAAAAILYTEDLNHGQIYGEVEARNPLAA